MFAAAVSHAQPLETLTLQKAREIALRSHPRIRSANLLAEAANQTAQSNLNDANDALNAAGVAAMPEYAATVSAADVVSEIAYNDYLIAKTNADTGFVNTEVTAWNAYLSAFS